MSPSKPHTIDACEAHWVSLRLRRIHSFGPGVGKYIKTKMNRRFRKAAKADVSRQSSEG